MKRKIVLALILIVAFIIIRINIIQPLSDLTFFLARQQESQDLLLGQDIIKKTIEATVKTAVDKTVKTAVDEAVENAMDETVKTTVEEAVENAMVGTVKPVMVEAVKKKIEATLRETVVGSIKKTVEETIEKTVEETIKKTIAQHLIPLSEEDFIIRNKDTFLGLDIESKDLKTSDEMVRVRYATVNHAYDSCVFENFTLLASSIRDGKIFEFTLITPVLETARGISVGDMVYDVLEVYGWPDEEPWKTDGLLEEEPLEIYRYDYKHDYISFYVNASGKVTKIQFDSL